MGISEIVNVSINLTSVNPTRASFGNGLIAAYTTAFTDRVRTYLSLPAVAVDFPATTAPVYLAAQEFFAANPSPTTFKVGRRALGFLQTWTLGMLDATAGDTVALTIDGKAVSCTASASTVTGAANLAGAITSATITGISATNSGGSVVTMSCATTGHVVGISGWDRTKVQLKNTTPDPGVQTDLNAIVLADPNFYGFVLDSQGAAELAQAASWAESNVFKELFYDSCDWDCVSTTTTDIGSTLKAAARTKSFGLFNGQNSIAYPSAAAMAQSLVNDPGSYTMDLKTLSGITPDNLTDTESGNAQGKNLNVYRSIAGVNVLTYGTNASGAFEDTIRFKDWLVNEIQVRVLACLAGAKKIPYTNKGARTIGAVIQGALNDGVRVGGITDDPTQAPFVTLPDVTTLSGTIITTRNLPNVTFTAVLAGAIQKTTIQGTLTGG